MQADKELWLEHALIAQAPDAFTMQEARRYMQGTAFTYDLGDYQEKETKLTFDTLCPVDRTYLVNNPMPQGEAMEYLSSIWGAGSDAGGLYILDDSSNRLFYQFQTLWRAPGRWFETLSHTHPDIHWDLFSLIPTLTHTGLYHQITRILHQPGQPNETMIYGSDHEQFATICDKYIGVPHEIL